MKSKMIRALLLIGVLACLLCGCASLKTYTITVDGIGDITMEDFPEDIENLTVSGNVLTVTFNENLESYYTFVVLDSNGDPYMFTLLLNDKKLTLEDAEEMLTVTIAEQ